MKQILFDNFKFGIWSRRKESKKVKKSKAKENNDVDDEGDVVPLLISTTVTESRPTVTSSTLYNWSATPLASLDHPYYMNEENKSLLSYSNLADEIKALEIKHNLLKDKNKASKPIKVLVQRHDKFTWKNIKTDAKMSCYTGILSVALFNTIFTLRKPYIPHITYWWKGAKKNWKEKMPTSLNPGDEFLLTLMRLRLGLLNEDVADGFDISFIFTT